MSLGGCQNCCNRFVSSVMGTFAPSSSPKSNFCYGGCEKTKPDQILFSTFGHLKEFIQGFLYYFLPAQCKWVHVSIRLTVKRKLPHSMFPGWEILTGDWINIKFERNKKKDPIAKEITQNESPRIKSRTLRVNFHMQVKWFFPLLFSNSHCKCRFYFSVKS